MFRFFAALARLVSVTEQFANSIEQADARFRSQLALDAQPQALDGPQDDAEEPVEAKAHRNGKKAAASR